MEGFFLVAAISVTIEGLVEYIKMIVGLCTSGRRRSSIEQMAAIVVGIAVCFASGADVYAAMGVTFLWPPLGSVLTGIFASRGANYLSHFVNRLKGDRESGTEQ